MRRSLITLLTLLMLAYAGICATVFASQRSLIYFPQPRALPAGMAEIWLQVEGLRLQVSAFERPGAPALIYFGGNAEDVSRTLADLRRVFPGHALYLPHYRGYGGSEGQPSEAALFADALALHRHVAQSHPRIEVVGRSLGSGIAVYLASQREVARLVLVTPFDSLASVAAEQFPWLPVDWLLLDRFESDQYAQHVRAPTLLLVAEQDELVRPERSEVLVRAFAPGLVELRVLSGVDHNSIGLHPDYGPALVAGGAEPH